MNLFENTLKLNGFPIAEAKEKLAKIKQISNESFENYIFKSRNEIVAYHLQNNSFYKKLIGNIDVSNWENIPVMTKRDLQCALEERLSNSFKKDAVYINKTSVSSGTPFIFAKYKFCHALILAEYIDWL